MRQSLAHAGLRLPFNCWRLLEMRDAPSSQRDSGPQSFRLSCKKLVCKCGSLLPIECCCCSLDAGRQAQGHAGTVTGKLTASPAAWVQKI